MHMKMHGIGWQILACLSAACIVVLVRYLSADLHPLQVTCFTLIFALIWMIPWLTKGNALLPERHLGGWYLARSLCSLGGTALAYYCYTQLPLPLATSLSFTTPIFASVFAMFFFQERVDMPRLFALAIAFGGVLIIARPGSEHFNLYALLMVASSALIACSILIIKRLTVNDRPRHIVFYSLMIMAPISFAVSLPFWRPVELAHLPWLAALGFLSSIQQIASSRALARADVVVIMAFDYLRLVFVAVLAYLFFAEVISLWTVVGSLIILNSALYALQRERRLTRNMPPQ